VFNVSPKTNHLFKNMEAAIPLPDPTIDLRFELARRLIQIQALTGIPANAWNWMILHYLDTKSADLWSLIVYAGILLRRSQYFVTSEHQPVELQRSLVNAALSIATKQLHDGKYFLGFCRADDEVDLGTRLEWRLVVGPEEFALASVQWGQ
jgi:hypothetical protein